MGEVVAGLREQIQEVARAVAAAREAGRLIEADVHNTRLGELLEAARRRGVSLGQVTESIMAGPRNRESS